MVTTTVKPTEAHVAKWGKKLAGRLAAATNRAVRLGAIMTESYLDNPYARHATVCECSVCRENRALTSNMGPNWMESGS